MERFKHLTISLRVMTLALAVAVMGGCGGSNDLNGGGGGTPSASVDFSMQLQGDSAPTQAMAIKAHRCMDDAGTVIDLTDVRVGVGEVEFFLPPGVLCEDLLFTFVAPVRCESDDDLPPFPEPSATPGGLLKSSGSRDDEDEVLQDRVVVDGPFVADLILGTTTPPMTDLLIPAGTYTRIDVRIEDNPALDGFALVAAGTFEYQGELHELRLALRFHEDIRFKDRAGITLEETAANDIVMALDATAWFQGIDLAACLDSGELQFEADGSLAITESLGGACNGIEKRIRDNIEASGTDARDDDDDDDDDDDEDDDDEDEDEDDDDEDDDDDDHEDDD
ncbi:MAG TPA: hypothetical protein VJP40_10150 [bacterium]|nr:hypothetical protein [bacterium]